MKTKTRHGVDGKRKKKLEGLDMAEYEKLIERLPEHERQATRDRATIVQARWNWQGKDWPKPSKNGIAHSVAIVGMATSKLVAPFGKPGWELWGLNDPVDWPGCPARHAFTRWFQLHPPHYLSEHYQLGLKDLARHWGKKTGIRLYMDRHYPEYPDSEPYPRELTDKMVKHGWYHASSFDWMVALAIHEGFQHIGIYGCDFYAYPITNREPIAALPCMSYWLGVAEGRGIEVEVHGGGHLFRILHMAVYESGLQYGWDREPGHDLRTKGTKPDKQWRDHR